MANAEIGNMSIHEPAHSLLMVHPFYIFTLPSKNYMMNDDVFMSIKLINVAESTMCETFKCEMSNLKVMDRPH